MQSINEAFLPVLFNCGASRSGQSVSMSKEVLDSSLDEPELETVVVNVKRVVTLPPDCSRLHEFIPEVEVTTATPQPVPSMKEVNGHVYDMISSIASLMKPEAEKKLGKSYIIFDPVYYMKKGSISYCLRVSGLV